MMMVVKWYHCVLALSRAPSTSMDPAVMVALLRCTTTHSLQPHNYGTMWVRSSTISKLDILGPFSLSCIKLCHPPFLQFSAKVDSTIFKLKSLQTHDQNQRFNITHSRHLPSLHTHFLITQNSKYPFWTFALIIACTFSCDPIFSCDSTQVLCSLENFLHADRQLKQELHCKF
jgi:hypothetical protein